MADEILEVYSAAEIAERVRELAWDITQAYEGRDFTILGALEDSFIFLADLLRAINKPTRTAFLRYDHQAIGGVQDISFSTQVDLSRRDVLLVEGVLDTGVTQEYLIKQLGAHGVANVRLCVLIDKPDRRRVSFSPTGEPLRRAKVTSSATGLVFRTAGAGFPILRPLRARRVMKLDERLRIFGKG